MNNDFSYLFNIYILYNIHKIFKLLIYIEFLYKINDKINQNLVKIKSIIL